MTTGSGFGPARTLQLAATALAAGDLDRDGDIDLILGLDSAVVFLRNRGNSEFTRPVTLIEAVEAAHLAIADLDVDLWPDLVFVESSGSLGTALNLGR